VIQVGRLAPFDQWDQNLLDLLFANELYPTGLEFGRRAGYPHTDGAVLIIPGRYWHQRINEISEALSRYQWVLAIRTGDEEDLFDVDRVVHPNIRWWVQTPNPDRAYPKDARFLPIGFPPHFNALPELPPDRVNDVFLSAQNTHERRQRAFAALDDFQGYVGATEGFTRGLPPDEYAALMCSAKVAPCPSGAVCQDTFRIWEALEAHTVPVVDAISPVRGDDGFWKLLFGAYPFDTYWDSRGLANDVNAIASAATPGYANRVTSWWMRYKRNLALWLRDDLERLGAL
jgi:hypothetical protein